jgi:hypothetical protein
LAGSRKSNERFRAHLHEESIDQHQIYLKLRGPLRERTSLTKNWEETVLKGSKAQKSHLQTEKSKPNEPETSLGKELTHEHFACGLA